MKKKIILIFCLCIFPTVILAEPNWVPLKTKKFPILLKGTYMNDSNITEPKPQKSKYLQVLDGGVVIISRGAGFYLNTKVIKNTEKDLYIKIIYENPLDKNNPFINDMQFTPDAEQINFSSPDVISGITGYGDYLITVKIYEDENSEEAIDVLKQKVRSYADTRTDQVLVFYNLKFK